MRRSAAGFLLALLLPLPACGGDDADDDAVAAAPSSAASAASDPKGDWTGALAQVCRTFSSAVSGTQRQQLADGKVTPEEVLAAEKAARPAVAEFDAQLAALQVPPEAAEAAKALEDFLVRSRPNAAELLAAARAGDQARLTSVLGAREKLRLEGYQLLYAQRVPEQCTLRGTFS